MYTVGVKGFLRCNLIPETIPPQLPHNRHPDQNTNLA
jgi:hypothetical protein